MKDGTRRREQVTGVLHSPIGSEQSVDGKNEREDEDRRKERGKTMSDDQRVSRHLWIDGWMERIRKRGIERQRRNESKWIEKG